jgi:hypothetical protein
MCYKCNIPLGSCEYMLLLYFTLRLLSLEHNLWGNLLSLVYSIYKHLQVIKVSFHFIQTSRISHHMNWDCYWSLYYHSSTSSYTSSDCSTYCQSKLTSTFCFLSLAIKLAILSTLASTHSQLASSIHIHTCNLNEPSYKYIHNLSC